MSEERRVGTEPAGSRVEAIDLAGGRWLEAVAAGLFVPAFVLLGGPLGFAAGVLVAGAWYAIGTPYAIALAHVAFVVWVPDGATGADLAILWGPSAALLLAPALRSGRPIEFGLATVVATLALGALAWVGIGVDSVPIAGALLVGGFVLAAYALHRHELVTTGRVDDEFVDRAATDTSVGERGDGERTTGEQPGTDRFGTDRLGIDQPGTDRSSSDQSDNDRRNHQQS